MASMTPEQHHLVERVRALVDDEPDVREVSMFGGRAIMVNDKMIVSAGRSGDLLVRVAADRHETLLREPGAEQAQMGAGRVMGPSLPRPSPTTTASPSGLTSPCATTASSPAGNRQARDHEGLARTDGSSSRGPPRRERLTPRSLIGERTAVACWRDSTRDFITSRAELSTGRVHRLVYGCGGLWDVAIPPVHNTRSAPAPQASTPAGDSPHRPPCTLTRHPWTPSFG